jgi:hypothetical protein
MCRGNIAVQWDGLISHDYWPRQAIQLSEGEETNASLSKASKPEAARRDACRGTRKIHPWDPAQGGPGIQQR